MRIPFPPVDLVFARDTFSFLKKEDQERIINDLEDLLKPERNGYSRTERTVAEPGMGVR